METLIFNKQFKDFLKTIGFKKENSSAYDPDDKIFYTKEYGNEFDVFGNISIKQNWDGQELALEVVWPTISDLEVSLDLETATIEQAEEQIKKAEEQIKKVETITAEMKADLLKVVKKARELQTVNDKSEFISYSAKMRDDGYAEVFGTNTRGQKVSLGITAEKITDSTSKDARQALLQDVIRNFKSKKS